MRWGRNNIKMENRQGGGEHGIRKHEFCLGLTPREENSCKYLFLVDSATPLKIELVQILEMSANVEMESGRIIVYQRPETIHVLVGQPVVHF